MADATGPYDSLEPTPTSGDPRVPGPSPREPSASKALWRGLRRRCPRCGSGDLFARRLTIKDRCPACRLRLQREEGGFLGAMTINYAVTALVWLAVLVVWLSLDLPDVHVALLTIVSLVIAGLVPVLFFPYAKTIWAAIDYLVYRSSPEYAARDAAERAEGNGGRY